jgi:hypothetical protein
MQLTLTPQKLADEISYNVIADLKGSGPRHRSHRRRSRRSNGHANRRSPATPPPPPRPHPPGNRLDG